MKFNINLLPFKLQHISNGDKKIKTITLNYYIIVNKIYLNNYSNKYQLVIIMICYQCKAQLFCSFYFKGRPNPMGLRAGPKREGSDLICPNTNFVLFFVKQKPLRLLEQPHSLLGFVSSPLSSSLELFLLHVSLF